MHLLEHGLFRSWRGVGRALAAIALAFLLYSEPAALGQGGPTLQCDTYTAPWVQVNGANTGAAQYIDAGEPINIPEVSGYGGPKTFASVVTNNGDLIYAVPSVFGTRLGRLTAAKQWQLWTDSGWSNSPGLAPRIIENTVLFYRSPKLFAHPTAPGGVIGVANALVHSGGNGFDFHNFRANFEFDGSQFQQWIGGVSYDRLYAKQLIPGRLRDPVDFAYDPTTNTGIAVGGYGADEAYDDTKLSAVRFDFNDTTQKWRRWQRESSSDPGHWLTDADIQAGFLQWTPRHVNVLDWNTTYAYTNQSRARITRIPSTNPSSYLVTFRHASSNQNFITAARYTDDILHEWQWWHAGEWQSGPANPMMPDQQFDYGAVVGSVSQQVAWHGGKVVIFSSIGSGLYETIYDDTSSTFSTPQQIVYSPLFVPTYYDDSSLAIGVDGDNKLWLAFTTNGTAIMIYSRAVNKPWKLAGSFTAPSKSVPVGISFINGNCLPVVFVERTIDNPDPSPDEVRLYAISPNVPYWAGESVLSVNPPPAAVTLDSQYLDFVSLVPCETTYTASGYPPGSVGVDADGYVYAPNMGWSATTIIPPLVNGMPAPMNYSWGSRNFDASIFAQAASVDRVRNKVYIANRAVGGSEEDLLPSPYNGKITVWNTSLRTTNCGWNCGKCNDCPPPMYFYDSRCIDQPVTPIAGLAWPSDVAVDQNHGLLYVAEGMECKIHVYTLAGIVSTTPSYLYSFGSRGTGNKQFMFVKGIDVDSEGNLFAVDCGNNRIQKWFRNATTGRVDGSLPYTWGVPGRGEGQFINPVGLDIDESLGRVYVSDPVNRRVQAFDTNGAFLFQFSEYLDDGHHPLSRSVGVGSDDAGTFFIGIDDNIARFRFFPD